MAHRDQNGENGFNGDDVFVSRRQTKLAAVPTATLQGFIGSKAARDTAVAMGFAPIIQRKGKILSVGVVQRIPPVPANKCMPDGPLWAWLPGKARWVWNGKDADNLCFKEEKKGMGIFTKLVGGAAGFLTGGPAGALVGAGLIGGGGKRDRILNSRTEPLSIGAGDRRAPCFPGFFRDEVDGKCKPDFLGGRAPTFPRPDPVNGVARGAPFEVTTGAFGMPASVPKVEMREHHSCPTGMVLGEDGLCYPKAVLRRNSRFRRWKPGARPVLTGGQRRSISKARTAVTDARNAIAGLGVTVSQKKK